MNSKWLPVQLSHRESVILCRCLDVFWINHITIITCTNRAPLFSKVNDDSSFCSKINKNNVHWIVQAMPSTKSGTPSSYPHTSSPFWKIYSGRILKETVFFLFFFCVLFVLYNVMIEYLCGRSAQQINTLPPNNEVIFCNVFLVPVKNTSSWVYWISSPNPSIFIATMKT